MNDILEFIKRLHLFAVQFKRLVVGLWDGTLSINEKGELHAPNYYLKASLID